MTDRDFYFAVVCFIFCTATLPFLGWAILGLYDWRGLHELGWFITCVLTILSWLIVAVTLLSLTFNPIQP